MGGRAASSPVARTNGQGKPPMKIPVLRRALMATAIATSLVSGTMIAAPAQAQFGGIVYDPSNYAQNVLTAARTLQQINNQIQQIQNQATSLINEARNLASRSEEHTSELQSLMRISYAVFCLKK